MTFEVRGFQARLQQTERITGYMCNRLICCHHWHPEQVTTLPEKLALKWPKIISVTLERITCYIRARQICGHEWHRVFEQDRFVAMSVTPDRLNIILEGKN